MEPYVCSSSPFWFWFLKGLNEASVADYAGKDCLTPTTCTDVGASLALLRRLMITEILYLLLQIFLLVLPPFRSTDLFGGAGTGARGLRLSAVLIWARATTSTGMPRRHTPSPRLAISAAAGQRWWRACQSSAPNLRRLEFFLTISPASVRRAQHLRISQVSPHNIVAVWVAFCPSGLHLLKTAAILLLTGLPDGRHPQDHRPS